MQISVWRAAQVICEATNCCKLVFCDGELILLAQNMYALLLGFMVEVICSDTTSVFLYRLSTQTHAFFK